MVSPTQLTFIETGWEQHVNPFQYYVEDLDGFAEIKASPVFVACPLVSDVNIQYQKLVETYFGDNDYNRYKILPMGNRYKMTGLKFAPYDTTFLKLITTLPDYSSPATNLASSLSFLRSWNQSVGSYSLVKHYQLYKGCRAEMVDINIAGGLIEISCDFSVTKIDTPITTADAGLTTPTIIDMASITGTQWTHIDNNQLPFRVNSVDYPVERFRVTIQNQLTGGSGKAYNGSSYIDTNRVRKRTISGEFTVPVGKDLAIEGYFDAATLPLYTSWYKVKPSAAQIDLTEVALENLGQAQSARNPEEFVNVVGFSAKTFALTP